MKFRILLVGNAHGVLHLVDHIDALARLLVDSILGTALRGVAQHGDIGFGHACHAMCRLRRRVGDLRKLVGSRIRCDGNVAHHDDTIIAHRLLVGEQEHGSADARDARRTLDDLQGGTQSLSRG